MTTLGWTPALSGSVAAACRLSFGGLFVTVGFEGLGELLGECDVAQGNQRAALGRRSQVRLRESRVPLPTRPVRVVNS
ncbi:MAG: hypothetical protein QOE40_1281 [Actinomycetota bacterium]|jgi:hypothetical protein|nr:hypothetical protein [Actinomycetota bacterium]